MPEFSEEERQLLLAALWCYQHDLLRGLADGAFTFVPDTEGVLSTVTDAAVKLGGDPDALFFGAAGPTGPGAAAVSEMFA